MDTKEIISCAVKLVFAIITAVITAYVIPWLKEKRVYGVISQFVHAAEKYAQTHQIDKKEWVIEHLKEKGIKVTNEIEALIESAVEELDVALNKAEKSA